MAKQDEQKQKSGLAARQRKAVASVPARFSAARTKTAIRTKTVPQLAEVDDGSTPTDKLQKLEIVPETIRRRQFLIGGVGLAVTTVALGGWLWHATPQFSGPPQPVQAPNGDRLVVDWNNVALEALNNQHTPLPVAARALSIVHTSMFDAWAAYNPDASGTRLGASLRQPTQQQTQANKCRAISYAAYRALVDLLPGEQARFQRFMNNLGYHPADSSTPANIGNRAAQAVLDFRYTDGSNQLAAYADYTHYQPVNTPETLAHPNQWQPLGLAAEKTGMKIQRFACAQWANVTPFALASALQFVPKPGPPLPSNKRYTEQAQQILQYSAKLTGEEKAIAEYWTAIPEMQILARWFAFAQFISQRDSHTLDQNIKLFFSLANAALDTSIACWATKRAYNSAYPITIIRYLFKGQQIHAWAGPGKGLQSFDGQYWLPYQPMSMLSPSYPEYCSEQSTFSAACAEILRNFTGSDALGTSYTQLAYSSLIESDTPTNPVTLSWPTLSQAASQAGMAGLYSGIHFPQSDLDGRILGSQVAAQVWQKAQGYIGGK